uniref:NIMA related kinase 10 n=1 Tax=Coturnix japonica TaxID=93934 RepID=A0A8C2YBZ5_COTJA
MYYAVVFYSRDYSDLKRLQSLLNAPSSKQQLSAIHFENGLISITRSLQSVKIDGQKLHRQWQESTEAVELENFSVTYKNERNFSKHPSHKLFQDIFTALVKNRFNCREWVNQAPSIHFLRVLICLRLLIRDPCYQVCIYGSNSLLFFYYEISTMKNTNLYNSKRYDSLCSIDILQKIAAVKNQREWVVASGAHKTLVNLLSARDSNVLLGALLALISLAESPECREKISELTIVENLLVILREYDLLSKRLTAELLRLLCAESQVKEQVKIYEGVPVLLSLLHSDHIKLLWSVVWVLVQVCEDPETSVEIRIWGGIKQLLHILQGERNLVSDRSSVGSLSSANAAGRIQLLHLSDDLSLDEIQENTFSLQAACCAAITELVLNDTNAYQVVQVGRLYSLFLFMERNRHIFRRLFPTDLFEIFIDIGHYVRDISAYEELVSKLNLLKEDELKQIAESIESVNQNKAPTKHIGNYAILEHLGSGAFGSVYKVRKHNGQNLLAMKEVNLHNPAFGKDKKDRESRVRNIVSELTIIKEQLYHPNVVRYYRTFLENDRLYIVMELIDGVPLGEHCHSLKEKQQQFTEERIWNIFIQLCLALRYLHKEKRIVHRDLTPNNVMLGDKDKVKITDFGLAKQKQENSKLASVVGTILYSCPEVVKCEPYGEKADVWAAGCILYQMATLNPPFYSTNMLSLATKIVGAVYEPVPDGLYSEKVSLTIKRCLTPDAETRPDIVEVSSLLSDVMMKYLDVLSTSHLTLEKKLDRERRRTQRYFTEANRNAAACQHQLCILPQNHYDKLRLQGSTIGTASCKTDFSENFGILTENCHSTCRKDEKRTYEEILIEDDSSLENSGKDLFSELDDELDALDNSSSSSSSHLKQSAFDLFFPFFYFTIFYFNSRDCIEGLGSRLRPVLSSTASAGIAVSQRKVRQISDPVQQILIQLHKIIFITQLPPALQCNLKRRVIERFKKSLFSQQSNPCNLKSEMKKVQYNNYYLWSLLLFKLKESGYYNFSSNR